MTMAAKIPDTERGHSAGARVWLLTGPGLLTLVVCSYFLADRPLATLAHEELWPWRRAFDALTHLIDPLPPLAGLVLLWTMGVVARGRTIGPVLEDLVRAAGGLCCAIVVKDQLKYAFGRTWPETWINGNPSFFRDGAYGFVPFHGGPGWFAFPSGHATTICAAAAAAWMLWPRGRPLYALAAVLVAIGLIGADYHWLSDIIAGGAVGTAFGVAAARVGRNV